tara:strand:- start:123694 stop:124311 length:618 start_codon:yes stop_codon:yes gene_type:complete
MVRYLKPGKIIVASHNPGKVMEISDLLNPLGYETLSAKELGLMEPEETGKTFIENAEIKAKSAAENTSIPAIADDSGLCVDLLLGEPGIFSARWAGPKKDFSLAMNKVENALNNKNVDPTGQKAKFVCALSLCWPDGHCENFEGQISGTLSFPPKGKFGFGYDPIFKPLGFDITFGEMDPDKKHSMSHRAEAFNQLVKICISEKK